MRDVAHNRRDLLERRLLDLVDLGRLLRQIAQPAAELLERENSTRLLSLTQNLDWVLDEVQRHKLVELQSLLGLEGRRVLLAVADGTEAEARVDARKVGVKPEDHVMDLEG